MKTYLIRITAQCPAPRFRDYRLESSGFRSAIGRAIALFRKDISRKKIIKLKAEAEVLAGLPIQTMVEKTIVAEERPR